MKAVKQYFCPYCGKTYRDNIWTIDHIIPKQIGGSNNFSVISCKDCNNKISVIEQSGIQTLTINWLITEMYEDGFKIKSRRKRGLIPLQKEVGLAFASPMKMFYDPEKNERMMLMLSPPLLPLPEKFWEQKSFVALTPTSAFKDNENDTIALLSLINKIVLGTCAWLWGEKFSQSKSAMDLRNQMWNFKLDDVLEMKSSEKHLELPSKPSEDALDNKPHHSILIGKLEHLIVGLVNLFGSFESLTVIGDTNDDFNKWLNCEGIVVISKTTKNEVLKMTWEEYKKYKLVNSVSAARARKE